MNRLLSFIAHSASAAVLISALNPPAGAQPKRVTGFSELLESLKSGYDVRLVIEYAKCRLYEDDREQASPDATGGMLIDTYEVFAAGVVRNPKAYLATSETHLIAHPRHGHVLNYVRVRFFEDDSVHVTARYLKPHDHEVVMDETFHGMISKGNDGHGVHLFAR